MALVGVTNNLLVTKEYLDEVKQHKVQNNQ